nr:hypothetical protein [Thauera aminoaromatica]
MHQEKAKQKKDERKAGTQSVDEAAMAHRPAGRTHSRSGTHGLPAGTVSEIRPGQQEQGQTGPPGKSQAKEGRAPERHPERR